MTLVGEPKTDSPALDEAAPSVEDDERPSGIVDGTSWRVRRGVGFLARMRTPLGEVRPYVRGETPVARLLAVPAVCGLISACAITWGASLAELAVHLEVVQRRGVGFGHGVPSLVLRRRAGADRGRFAAARRQEPLHRAGGRLRRHGAHDAGVDRVDPRRPAGTGACPFGSSRPSSRPGRSRSSSSRRCSVATPTATRPRAR